MRYISLFSGIEAASVAWEPLGWEPVAFSEIEPFPCELLRQRFPDVPNLGDITKIDWSPYREAVDLIVGGSPCQSFSIAGNREGLTGESGLMFEYIRAVREVMPRYFVWENVPGALSSEKGAAFGQLLREMDDIGYGLAWRVLDAQFFGVAQRRRRVFLVGCLGDPERASEILFESEILRWDNPSSRDKRKSLAERVKSGLGGCYSLLVRCGCAGGGKGALIQDDVSATLSTSNTQTIFQPVYAIQGDIARGAHMGQNGKGWSDDGAAYTLNTIDVPAICMASTQAHAEIDVELCGTLTRRSYKDAPVVAVNYIVRHLMPLECERLQGFPSVVNLEVMEMTPSELIACALANGDVFCDFKTGKVYGTRGNGGMKLDKPRELGFIHPSGYVHISLHAGGEKKQVRAHRIVYQAAYGEIPDGFVIDHINGDKTDNRLCNLQMMTAEGNSRKARMDGAYLTGEDNPATKISAEVRSTIIHEYATGNTTYRNLAKKYGVSKSRVGQIVKESGWTDIEFKGKPASDTARYKALGNSMAVPVMRWIGERIAAVSDYA